MSQTPGWGRRVLIWLTRPYWSRLDGFVIVFLTLTVVLRPGWWAWAAVAVFMVGVGFMTSVVRRSARLPRD